MPDSWKLAVSILSKSISWLAWAFVIIGMLLKLDFFSYWLAFFFLVEGCLFAALIYVLVVAVRYSLMKSLDQSLPPESGEANIVSQVRMEKRERLLDVATKGVVGNIAFYFFLLAAFIVLKSMGVLDATFAAAMQQLR